MMIFIFIFIFGLLAGSLATYFHVTSYWTKRLKATRQSLLDQYNSDIRAGQQQWRQLESRESQWLKQQAELTSRESALVEQLEAEARVRQQLQAEYEKRLVAEKHVSRRSQNDYEARLWMERDDRAELQSKCDSYKLEARANVDELLQESLAIEQQNRSLNTINKQLEDEKKVLETALHQEREQHQKALEQAYQEPNVDFGKIISKLFPHVKLMRDSLSEINRHKGDTGIILCQLQALNYRDFSDSRKVHATSNGWWEWRPSNTNLLRIYYRKKKGEGDGCEVLVSYKKDSKTQAKDMNWLKEQPK